jgi:hypothetical protein
MDLTPRTPLLNDEQVVSVRWSHMHGCWARWRLAVVAGVRIAEKGQGVADMWFRKLMATSMAIALALGSAPLLAQQGAISGQATDEAESPYSEYSVRLVRPDTGEIVSSQVSCGWRIWLPAIIPLM